MKNIHRQLLAHICSGDRVVLATVFRTSGSTPQKPGSSALFGEKGLIAGTVGGGLLEGEIQQIATHVLISGVSDTYFFSLDSDQGEEGAICGGEAEVLIDADPAAHPEAVVAMDRSLQNREEGYILTLLNKKPGNGQAVERHWLKAPEYSAKPKGIDPGLWDAISRHFPHLPGPDFIQIDLREEPGHTSCIVYLERFKPLSQLVIAGAGHVGKALARLGNQLDFEVTVIDDREEFASSDNIPEADHFIVADIGISMQEYKQGPDTYVVIVTRGHNHDAEALKPCIGSDAAYVGMIGSKHKVAVMKQQFIDQGWATVDQWSRIHTPIGIPIGSKTVEEIAVSIAAELVRTRSQIQLQDAT